MSSKEEEAKDAQENWDLARRWDKAGNHAKAEEARSRAIDCEKARDSWLYRTFGW